MRDWSAYILDGKERLRQTALLEEIRAQPDPDRTAAQAVAEVRWKQWHTSYEIDEHPCLRRVIKQTRTCNCAKSPAVDYQHLHLTKADHTFGVTDRKTGHQFYLTMPYRLTIEDIAAMWAQLSELKLYAEFDPEWAFWYPGSTHGILVMKPTFSGEQDK